MKLSRFGEAGTERSGVFLNDGSGLDISGFRVGSRRRVFRRSSVMKSLSTAETSSAPARPSVLGSE
jgi:hypothetical protein